MKGLTKFMIIFAFVLLFIGIVIFSVGMTKIGWDFKKLSTVKYETNAYEMQENFSNISIKTTTADILFAPADTDKCEVICHETITEQHSVSVENGTLTINAVNTKKWYDYIGIMALDTPKITVYLPKDTYSLLTISLSTGDISVSNLSLDELKLSTTTGDVSINNISVNDLNHSISTGNTNFTNITCKNLVSTGTTGKITLKNVVASELLSVKRSTGNINLDACDGGEIKLKTTTGNIKGTLLSEKIFKAKATTGSVSVPDTHSGDTCEISVTTGDIKIKIAE